MANSLGYQNPAVTDATLDSTPITYGTPPAGTPIIRENVQAFLTDDPGSGAVLQMLLMEMRAIRLGIQYLVSNQEGIKGGLNLIEAAQEYDEEVPV